MKLRCYPVSTVQKCNEYKNAYTMFTLHIHSLKEQIVVKQWTQEINCRAVPSAT